jgi:hypothetical protein
VLINQGSYRQSLIVTGLIVAGLTGCNVQYRHEVEEPGTAAKYNYGADKFARYDGYGDVAGDLQIASVDYKKPGSNVVVRLTGVIHIGDKEYYETLQREALDTADVVLFEGVKIEGQDENPELQAGGNLGSLYSQMGNLLGIGFQKDGIDYTRDNFVHCDMTLPKDNPLNQQMGGAQMQQALQMLGPIAAFKQMLTQGKDGQRTEDAIKHQMAQMMIMQMNGEDQTDLLEQLKGKDGILPPGMRSQAERAAKALKGSPIMPNMGMTPEMKELILDKRNEYVLEQLGERLANTDPSQKQVIAVFFGAAHNPGFAEGLEKLGYEEVSRTWFRAWAMNGRDQGYVVTDGGETPARSEVEPARPVQPTRSRQKRVYY